MLPNLVTTILSVTSIVTGSHLTNYQNSDTYRRLSSPVVIGAQYHDSDSYRRPSYDPLFVESDSFRGHDQSVRSPVTVSSPSPLNYHPYQQYPYFPSLTPTPTPTRSPIPSLTPTRSPIPSPSPSPYAYPFPPIPTYPPTTPREIPRRPQAPILTHKAAPAITFLDPDPLTSPASPQHIEIRHRSFTPRPPTQDAHQPESDQENHQTRPEPITSENNKETHLPALTLSPVSDDVIDNANDDDTVDTEVNDDDQKLDIIPATQIAQTVSARLNDSDADYSENTDEEYDEVIATTTQTVVTEPLPDITENEVVTEVTLVEVLDEVFSDPSLPSGPRQDVPRSPQFFIPTPIPTKEQLVDVPALTFENPLDDEHTFHQHFLQSAEGEVSLIEHMLRDEQDIANEEALHHLHHHHEEGIPHANDPSIAPAIANEIQTNIIPQNRPTEQPKGRRVLKKRPIRIKIPAKLRQNLQVIPESLNFDPREEEELPIEPPQLTPTTISPPIDPIQQEAEQEIVFQEVRQPKALTVFGLDYDDNDNANEANFGQDTFETDARDSVPQNFSPLFSVPSRTEEPRSQAAASSGQFPANTVNIDTSARFTPGSGTTFNANPNPRPPVAPILRQPSDYIFTPQQQPQQQQQFNFAPATPQQQQQPSSFQPQSFQDPGREQKAIAGPPSSVFNTNLLNRPSEAAFGGQPQAEPVLRIPQPPPPQQFSNNFGGQPQDQRIPQPPATQQFSNNFGGQPQDQRPPQPPPSQQQFGNNFGGQEQVFQPAPAPPQPSPQSFTSSFGGQPQEQSFANNFGGQPQQEAAPVAPQNTFGGSNPAQDDGTTLFQMLNREAAVRPVRTRLQDNDRSRNIPKSSALENLLNIAGNDWDKKLHTSPVSTSSASDFTCPRPEGHFPDPAVCNIYHACSGGNAHANTCQPGLAWNVVINMCDWEANVDCDINRGLKPIPITEDNPGGEAQQVTQRPQPFAAFTAFLF